ncbi:tyrosine/serine/threonine protein phosphatase pps1 [Mortierella sp. NVP85]|nr:tyrosine/serine/threonine protein phosphatase pps1 [Mortierella sp. NVP85]
MVATSLPSDSSYGNPLGTGSVDPASGTAIPPSFTLINSDPQVYAIDAAQLFRLHQMFVSTPLPSKAMFPWLHGVDGTNSAQNYFFGIEHHHYHTGTHFARNGADVDGNPLSGPAATRLPVPEHRGLMFIHASEHDPGRLVGSVSPSEILRPAPRTALSANAQRSNNRVVASDPYNSTQDINHHPQIHHQHSSIQQLQQQQLDEARQDGHEHDSDWADVSDDSATSSVCSSSLSSTTSSLLNSNGNPTSATRAANGHTMPLPYSSSFLNSLSEGINIRNFKIQVPRYALLSDMIVYAKEGEQDMVLLQLAKQISAAQEEVWKSIKEQHPQLTSESRRQTFVLTDTFAAFESKYPDLVAVSSAGKASKNKVDFWEQEREQMALLTRASEIAPGVWSE